MKQLCVLNMLRIKLGQNIFFVFLYVEWGFEECNQLRINLVLMSGGIKIKLLINKEYEGCRDYC